MSYITAFPASPFLDQTGHIYVTIPSQRQCLKLNRAASALWRTATTTGVYYSHLDEEQMEFLRSMAARNILRLVET